MNTCAVSLAVGRGRRDRYGGDSGSCRVGARRRFCLLLVKPSHYDDDGYVIQWMRSPIPSNSLAALYGLAKDCAERRVLGDDVDIEIHAFDEINTRIRPERLAAMIEEAGAGMVMLVGVQSNQFPRALDIARPLRAARHPGRHRRLPRLRRALACSAASIADLDRARAMGLSLFAGEAEGRLELVLRDAAAGALKPLYNYMDDLPAIEGTPIPLLRGRARAAHHRPAPPASTPAAAVPISARSAPSSTCRAASRAAARPTTSSASCALNFAQGLRALLHHRRQFRPQQGLGDRSSTA